MGAQLGPTEDTLVTVQPPCPSTSFSYLSLPAVDLETLKAEFQDDCSASGTVLGGRGLVEASITPPVQPWTTRQLQHPCQDTVPWALDAQKLGMGVAPSRTAPQPGHSSNPNYPFQLWGAGPGSLKEVLGMRARASGARV